MEEVIPRNSGLDSSSNLPEWDIFIDLIACFPQGSTPHSPYTGVSQFLASSKRITEFMGAGNREPGVSLCMYIVDNYICSELLLAYSRLYAIMQAPASLLNLIYTFVSPLQPGDTVIYAAGAFDLFHILFIAN